MPNKKSIRIPQDVIDKMVKSGACFEEGFDEDLCRLSLCFEDDAWKIYENWIESGNKDARVLSIFSPTHGTHNCPDDAIGFSIQREVNSIIFNYAHHFLPDVYEPLNVMPVLPIYIQDTKVLSCIMKTIKDPPENHPTLFSLSTGSYICHIHHQWKNGVVVISLYK